jgi:hypothetical protein
MLARATFARFQGSTEQDWKLIGQEFVSFSKGLPDRVMAHLKLRVRAHAAAAAGQTAKHRPRHQGD